MAMPRPASIIYGVAVLDVQPATERKRLMLTQARSSERPPVGAVMLEEHMGRKTGAGR
jgi:hypothetical protein